MVRLDRFHCSGLYREVVLLRSGHDSGDLRYHYTIIWEMQVKIFHGLYLLHDNMRYPIPSFIYDNRRSLYCVVPMTSMDV